MARKPSYEPGENGRVRKNFEFWPETMERLQFIISNRFDTLAQEYTEKTLLVELINNEYYKLKELTKTPQA